MPEKKHLSRPVLERREPIRNPVVNGSGDLLREVVGSGLDAARQAAYASNAAMQGVVESTVATAYTVIDQYMNRGYSAASLRYRSNGDRPMSEQPPYDRWARGATNPWMESWLQMMRFWTDSMTMFSGPAAQAWMGPWAPGAAAAPAQVSVEVQSKRPTLVTVEVQPGAEFRPLSVGSAKHCDDTEAQALDDVRIETRPGQVTVRLQVPDKQPAGRYLGVILDDGGHQCGHVHVEITKAPPKKSGKA